MSKSIKQRYDAIEADLIKKAGGVTMTRVGGQSPEDAKKHLEALAKNKEKAANRADFVSKCMELGIAQRQAFDASFFRAAAVNKDPVQAAVDYAEAFNQ